MPSLYTTVTSFILNVTAQPASYNYPVETSECFMFGKMCVCLSVSGNIGKSNSL